MAVKSTKKKKQYECESCGRTSPKEEECCGEKMKESE